MALTAKDIWECLQRQEVDADFGLYLDALGYDEGAEGPLDSVVVDGQLDLEVLARLLNERLGLK